MAIQTDSFDFAVPDAWRAKMVLGFSAPDGTRTVNLSNEPLADPLDAAAYADQQADVLGAALEGYEEIARYDYPGADGAVPVREYAWTAHGARIRQCQAYFVVGGEAWTMTFSAADDAYDAFREEFPALIHAFSPRNEEE